MVGWLRGAKRGDVFPFRVELGPPDYAILGADGREISDRWEQQKAMKASSSGSGRGRRGDGRGERPPPRN